MRRYLAILIIPAILFVAALTCMAVYFQQLEGDLTRVGGWAEREFGPNAPQPPVRIVTGRNHETNPDVLVLGDSFSRDEVWQSVLGPMLGLRIATYRIDFIDCIENWVLWAEQHPTAKIIVVESVERMFINRFVDIKPCGSRSYKAVKNPEKLTPAMRESSVVWPKRISGNYLLSAAKNTGRRYLDPEGPIRHNDVVNTAIDSRCARFSHRGADRFLYYSMDENKRNWTDVQKQRAAANLVAIQHAFAARGKLFFFVLAPDKLSVYYDCIPGESGIPGEVSFNTSSFLVEAGLQTPDLLSIFRSRRNEITDLYKPDDSHLSTSGYILLAQELGQVMRRAGIPIVAPPGPGWRDRASDL